MSDEGTPGRTARRTTRFSWRRPDVLTLVAILLPVMTLVVASFVHTDQERFDAVAPQETLLTRSTLICPPGGPEVSVATVSDAAGDVTLRSGNDEGDVAVEPGLAASLDLGRKAVVITGRDDLAPGLVANRFERPWANADCRPPVVDQWFTGVGAGAKHQSILQLVNPDAGRAVVDIVVLGRRGEVSVPALRGLAISGGATRRFDLAEIVPRRDDLALHVTTVRGRVSASVQDRFQELGRGQGGRDGLASQDEPSTSNLLLGLTAGRGQRTLIIANPTDDEGRATVRLVTADSVFAPAGAKDVVLPPQSVVRVGLAPLLQGTGSNDKKRPYGVQVDTTVATTIGLVMFVEGDLVQSVPTPPLAGPGAVVLPKADKELVLGGASGQGVAIVSSWDKAGRSLPDQRIEIAPDQGYVVDLPRKARLMTLLPQRATVSGVVLLTGDGATLVRIREPVLTGLEPYVEAGLP
ncbi:hypothetical protein BH09ACT12_BH09ACT12_33940 [soil metagenome]